MVVYHPNATCPETEINNFVKRSKSPWNTVAFRFHHLEALLTLIPPYMFTTITTMYMTKIVQGWLDPPHLF